MKALNITKIEKFVDKYEIPLILATLFFIGISFLHFPGKNIIAIIGLQALAGIYFITGIFENWIFKDHKQIINKLAGIGSGISLVGILFNLMHWPGWETSISVGTFIMLSTLIYVQVVKPDNNILIKKEAQFRLVALIFIGLSMYFLLPTIKPNEIQLYETIIKDFKIDSRILEVAESKEKKIDSTNKSFNSFWKTTNLDLISYETHKYYNENPIKLGEDSAYFSISTPTYLKDKTSAKIYVTYNCGHYCSYDGEYLYKIKNNRWYQEKLISGSEW